MKDITKKAVALLIERTSKEFKISIAVILITGMLLSGWLAFPLVWGKNENIDSTSNSTMPVSAPSQPPSNPVKEDITKSATIMVYVTGAVKKPGVYTLNEGARGFEAVNLAGGMLSNGDMIRINLAKKLQDEEMILVFSTPPPVKTEPFKTEPCSNKRLGQNKHFKQSGGFLEKYESANNDKISINTGSIYELRTIPGMGKRMAERIVRHREKTGNFSSVDELQEVPGMKIKVFNHIKNFITL